MILPIGICGLGFGVLDVPQMGLFVIRMPLVHGWATGIEPQVRIDRKIYMRDTFTFVHIAGSTYTHIYIHIYIYIYQQRERERERARERTTVHICTQHTVHA